MSTKEYKKIKVGQVWMFHDNYKECEKHPERIKSTIRFKILKIIEQSDGYRIYQFENVLDTNSSLREWNDSKKKNSLEDVLNKYYVLIEESEEIKIKRKKLNIQYLDRKIREREIDLDMMREETKQLTLRLKDNNKNNEI